MFRCYRLCDFDYDMGKEVDLRGFYPIFTLCLKPSFAERAKIGSEPKLLICFALNTQPADVFLCFRAACVRGRLTSVLHHQMRPSKLQSL